MTPPVASLAEVAEVSLAARRAPDGARRKPAADRRTEPVLGDTRRVSPRPHLVGRGCSQDLASRRAGSWSVSCAGDRLPAILIPL